MALITRRIRWYGHILHVTSCINLVKSMDVPSSRGQERPWTSSECVRTDKRASRTDKSCSMLNIPVDSYGHVGTVSSPNHTLSSATLT